MIHRELKRKHVMLSILRDEYIAQHPDGYRYSRFCQLSGVGGYVDDHSVLADTSRSVTFSCEAIFGQFSMSPD